MQENKLKTIVKSVLNEWFNDCSIDYQGITEQDYKVYHGTNSSPEELRTKGFDSNKIGSNTNQFWNGMGFYFSDNEAEATLYGNNVISASITLNNPIDLTTMHDTSVQGSGLVRLLVNYGFGNQQKFFGNHDGNKTYTYDQLNDILNYLEKSYDPKLVSYSEGNNEHFKHVWYPDNLSNSNGETDDFVLRNLTQNETGSPEYLKSRIIHIIMYEKYGISSLPIRISEAMSPQVFTQIAKQNGYDGVIAPNSTTFSGNEYVVFDKNQIHIN